MHSHEHTPGPSGHNASSQHNVVPNLDPALDTSREHRHPHLHHDAFAVQGREENVAYTAGTTFEKSAIPDASPRDHGLHQQHVSDEKAAEMSDAERGEAISPIRTGETLTHQRYTLASLYRRYAIFVHLFIWLGFTGWWIAGLILHRYDIGWIKPFLLWLAITLRLIFFHVPITIVSRPMRWVWHQTGIRFVSYLPEKSRTPLAALLVVAVILIGSFVTEETADNTRANRAVSLFGIVVFLTLLWATSRNRKKIVWHTVITGMLFQFIIALFVLRTKAGYDIFSFVSELARDLLGFADQGTTFLTADYVPELGWFLVSVIPAIIFFVSFVQLLFYWGVLQWCIGKCAIFFHWSMRVSGAEALVAAASPFIGQGESAMLIKPFVAHLTKAEIHQVMTSGFATIAGSVLVAYIKKGVNGQALISSCVMSIPASLAVSKLRYPEDEETLTSGRCVIPDDDEHRAVNVLHAFTNGAWLGIKIAAMMVTNLLCIIALVHLVDALLTWWGHYLNINHPTLTIETLLGYVCYPIAFLLGVPRQNGDLLKVGRLIGEKIVLNEFIAYTDLLKTDLAPRSRLIVTYALCGFANLGSLGTQIGVLSQVAPGRSGDISRVAVSALFSGVLSTFISASIAGLLVTDQAAFTSSSAPS
ncbi:hypothetical protein L228DRAFT_228305 [Xylona heveae TC161]|uniref:H+/nucleoside cotransporter-like protein n=1 Tax=Xylona heveae (strain CBS 132557 / TC161) TaxID=1328760 RepID=A0A165I3V4_XYLHT|nr:hypothetical protein L228DRAFT_228305 [Xylona heveae TC161]KZF24342.1 hypothetical protein L228DRAFT_228305 [Xylona heveae TC161]